MELPVLFFELKKNYLLVVGTGTRDNLKAMTEASAKIYEKILETNSRYLLVDYRNLQINVRLSEAFNIVKRYEVAQPDLAKIKIAALFSEPGMEFGQYWKEVSRQRGFFIEIFKTYEEAESWLFDQMK